MDLGSMLAGQRSRAAALKSCMDFVGLKVVGESSNAPMKH